jgi:hypothetical protein
MIAVRRSWVCGALLAGGLAAAAPALAGDGRLEISQTCALAGCFAGDTAGFPVTITAPGSYVLTSNLTVADASDAITASVDGVRIDLNGFQIAGPVVCNATIDVGSNRLVSVSCSGSGGTAIEGAAAVSNGTIRGFNNGITTPTGLVLRVDDLTVTQNATNGINPGGRGLVATDSVFATNAFSGIEGQSSSAHYTVRGCLFERNGDEALYLGNGVVTESVFHQNDEGLRSNVGGQALAVNNSFSSNVSAITGGDVAFRSNVFDNNGTNGGSDDLGANICDGNPC